VTLCVGINLKELHCFDSSLSCVHRLCKLEFLRECGGSVTFPVLHLHESDLELNVFHECANVWQTGVEKVKVELYSESLCPYCAQFIVNYLNPFFNNGLIDIVELRIIPYGNARVLDGKLVCQVRMCCYNIRSCSSCRPPSLTCLFLISWRSRLLCSWTRVEENL